MRADGIAALWCLLLVLKENGLRVARATPLQEVPAVAASLRLLLLARAATVGVQPR